ncbi:Ankyrin repeat domain-containing protein 17 (Ankyrin repeat domain-containing protein FOE) (Gene trap ankyrin repeat protein) [Durusdinium trenchii]|uniref:Ankyrin repeat domain-containing protein 17 (Ankyrin repeat domain-containing protein FOE) (Gene trap ankyrin repeat protein) n=1 Tax=Durusdinium trenchii TaxID=1381693 RepID=A0ABP0K3W5_9DINO
MGAQEDLRVAVACGVSKAVSDALDAGASVHESGPAGGWLPLHTASSMGHLGVLQLLLERKADIHQPSGRLRSQPLHLAAKEGHAEVVDFLLEQQADINAQDVQWRTPLSLACQKGQLEVVEVLATLGADLTLPDEALATPYDWALAGLSYLGERYATYEKILDLLTDRGAKVQGKSLGPLERCPYPSSRGPPNC